MFSSRPLILAPGDRAPAPTSEHSDWFDYRGCATQRELSGLFGRGLRFGRFVRPGRTPDQEMYFPPSLLERNCAVFGPPGSGKTDGIVFPWIRDLLNCGASVVTVDVKGDLVGRLEPIARRLGARFWYWNSRDPARSQSWNWMYGIRDDRDVDAAVRSVLGAPKPNDPQPFFHDRDCRWLRALIKITREAAKGHPTPQDLCLAAGDQDHLLDLFRKYEDVRLYQSEVNDLLRFSADEHSRAVSGLLNALHLFQSSEVRNVTERGDFVLSGIAYKPTLLVIGASLADAKTAEVLSSLILGQLFNIVFRRLHANAADDSLIPIYFVIDEAARLRTRIQYPEILSVARSAKVGFCIAAQDITQFGDEREAETVLANCSSIVLMRGASPHAARYLSGRLGQRTEKIRTASRQKGPFQIFSQHGATESVSTVPVLGEREIMHPPGDGYFAVAHVAPVSPKPFLIDLTMRS